MKRKSKMKKCPAKIPGAFTLVEIVVAMSIFLVIIYLAASMIGSYGAPAILTQSRIFVQTQTRQAVERISKELIQANALRIFIGDNNTSIRFNLPVESANGTLQFSSGGDIIWGDRTTEGNFIQYKLVNNALERRILNSTLFLVNGTNTTIASNITNFSVQSNYPQYTFNLTIFLDNYLGRPIPSPINDTISFTAKPQN